jgi:hypothetical protein
MMLDGHFVIEHIARNRSGRFFNFNGTAGIWRKCHHRRRGRLAARHAHRGHGPLLPRAAPRLAVHLRARRARAGRASLRDEQLQEPAVPLGQGLGADREEAHPHRPSREHPLEGEARGDLPPHGQLRVPLPRHPRGAAAAEHALRQRDDRPSCSCSTCRSSRSRAARSCSSTLTTHRALYGNLWDAVRACRS